jgi:predicted negative regulator of RcsB-dependent stress response
MENEPVAKNQIQSAPVSEVITPETKKKVSPWVWAIGGCLLIVFLFMIVMGALGWWGYKAAKRELRKQTPAMKEFQQKMEKANKESDEWEEESRSTRNSMPDETALPELK